MCFIVKTKRQMTAKRDIECYKLFTKSTEALCSFFTYKINTENTVINLHPIGRKIEEGYHSYKNYNSIDYGWIHDTLRRCIIPKGSKYYVNDTEYVSSNIIVKEILAC